MKTRRDFLKLSSLASTAIAFPQVFQLIRNTQNPFSGKRLVVVQLSGGNDGLNTVVPFTNDLYYSARPKLGISSNEVLRLNHEIGFHPSLSEIRTIFEQGDMAIFNGVGYPEPNRSHFRSMDIWHTASGSDEYKEEGWLGKWSELQENTLPAIETNDVLSLALKAEGSKALAMENINRLQRLANDKILRAVAGASHDHVHHMASYLYSTARRVTEGTDYLTEKIGRLQQLSDYPNHPFGKDMGTIGSLINAGCETQVYYATLAGFDTHANQKATHARLLKMLGEGLSAFRNDLRKSGEWKNSLVMVFSEFGRRVKQNAGGGTDHGTANNIFLLGGGLQQAGIRNAPPSLSDLEDGDLKYQLDFREIYAGILKNWLATEPVGILGGNFAPVRI